MKHYTPKLTYMPPPPPPAVPKDVLLRQDKERLERELAAKYEKARYTGQEKPDVSVISGQLRKIKTELRRLAAARAAQQPSEGANSVGPRGSI